MSKMSIELYDTMKEYKLKFYNEVIRMVYYRPSFQRHWQKMSENIKMNNPSVTILNFTYNTERFFNAYGQELYCISI